MLLCRCPVVSIFSQACHYIGLALAWDRTWPNTLETAANISYKVDHLYEAECLLGNFIRSTQPGKAREDAEVKLEHWRMHRTSKVEKLGKGKAKELMSMDVQDKERVSKVLIGSPAKDVLRGLSLLKHERLNDAYGKGATVQMLLTPVPGGFRGDSVVVGMHEKARELWKTIYPTEGGLPSVGRPLPPDGQQAMPYLAVGSWNMRASSHMHSVGGGERGIACLQTKLSNLAAVAEVEHMVLIALQECPGKMLEATADSISHLVINKQLEGGDKSYLADFLYVQAMTGHETAGFLYHPQVIR